MTAEHNQSSRTESGVDLVPLDDEGKYTYRFKGGQVSMLRHGEPWVERVDQLAKPWIAAANTIAELREENERLKQTVEALNGRLAREQPPF